MTGFESVSFFRLTGLHLLSRPEVLLLADRPVCKAGGMSLIRTAEPIRLGRLFVLSVLFVLLLTIPRLSKAQTIDLNTLGNTDTVIVNDLSGTDVTTINVDLASTLGGATGDALADTIGVNGTALPDTISITANALLGNVQVSGLAAFVRIEHPEASYDDLIVNGLGGTDTFSVGLGVTSLIGVTTNP